MRIDIFWASNCGHRTLQSPSRLATSYLVAARTITHISTLDTAADKRAISASHSGLRTTAHDAMRQTPGRCRRIQTACLFDAASQRSVREPHTFLPCYHLLSGVCSTLSLTVADVQHTPIGSAASGWSEIQCFELECQDGAGD